MRPSALRRTVCSPCSKSPNGAKLPLVGSQSRRIYGINNMLHTDIIILCYRYIIYTCTTTLVIPARILHVHSPMAITHESEEGSKKKFRESEGTKGERMEDCRATTVSSRESEDR